jgi:Protein of unknown function (DUF4242)
MPRYMIERQFEVTEDQMPDVGRRSRRIIEEKFPQIRWEHSHVALDDSGKVKTYCIYEASAESEVRAHANELGQHTIVAIREVVGDVTPDDFPPV